MKPVENMNRLLSFPVHSIENRCLIYDMCDLRTDWMFDQQAPTYRTVMMMLATP